MLDVSVADFIVARFGGIHPTARALGKPVSTIQGWKKRGTIPPQNWPDIEQAAFAKGWLDLTARWLGEAHADQETRARRDSLRGDDKLSKCGAV
jgi:hypothetical protein